MTRLFVAGSWTGIHSVALEATNSLSMKLGVSTGDAMRSCVMREHVDAVPAVLLAIFLKQRDGNFVKYCRASRTIIIQP